MDTPPPDGPAGLILDWGGVLTAPLDGAIGGWADREQVDRDHLGLVLRGWSALPEDEAPMHRLERGELALEDFEHLLAAELDRLGSAVAPAGLVTRMLAGIQDLDPRMLAAVRTARAAGVRTALLSNSWGEHYRAELFEGLFDAVVISGRVGMRKPEPAIYRHTTDLLGLEPSACVMVDDLARNVHAAVALGMVGVLHTDVETTLMELAALFGLPLGEDARECY